MFFLVTGIVFLCFGLWSVFLIGIDRSKKSDIVIYRYIIAPILIISSIAFFYSSYVSVTKEQPQVNTLKKNLHLLLQFNPYEQHLMRADFQRVKGRGIVVSVNDINLPLIGGYKLVDVADINASLSSTLPGNSFGDLPSRFDYVVYCMRIPLIPATHSAVVPATCSGHPGHFIKHSEAGCFYLTCADRSASI